MSSIKPIVISVVVLISLLACGGLPQAHLSFDTQGAEKTSPLAEKGDDATTAPTTTEVTVIAPPTLSPSPTPLPRKIVEETAAEEMLLINLYQRVSPSVVSIQAVKTMEGIEFEFEHPDLPEGVPTPELPAQPFQQSGEGSGFVVDTEGHIVTNNHVVEDTSELLVTFYEGTMVPATIVGTDPDSDLAVIKVEVPPESLRPITWGDSDQVQVGQRAVAIGNPFGFENTLTTGIISGLSRSLPAVTGYRIPEIIQTDAAINPGNSGGPLLNSMGEVIGVNSAIVPNFNQLGERSFLGVGFAVPSNLAQRVVPVLIEKGAYVHPWFGFVGMDVLPDIAAEMNLPRAQGALVIRVIPDGPADKAGLRGGTHEIEVMGRPVTVGGDVVIGLGGSDVRRFDDILAYLDRYGDVGQELELTIIRDGKTQTLTVTLGKRQEIVEEQ